MRISLLLEREPFGKILEETLAEFLGHKLGRPHQVVWYAKSPGARFIRKEGQQPWLCNTHLNAIFVPNYDAAVIDPVRKEFERSPLLWRRPVQRAYVSLATTSWAAGMFARAALGVSPPLANPERLLILGGNHRIRVLDGAEGDAFSILKSGWPAKPFQRELRARRLASSLGLPVPALREVDVDGTWFCEQYVRGTPLNRINEPAEARRALLKVYRALRRFLNETAEDEPLSRYVDRVSEEAVALVNDNPLIDPNRKTSLKNAVGWLARRTREMPTRNRNIRTALTHGDFHPGNVLVEGDKEWIIDWEYSARRQELYDSFVYGLRSRAPEGLAGRIEAFEVHGGLRPFWKDESRANGKLDRGARALHATIFLLEELHLRLEENHNKRLTRLGQGLLVLEREIGYWNRSAELNC